jgi:N-carbamoyl-L-amino-acid hydrolase
VFKHHYLGVKLLNEEWIVNEIDKIAKFSEGGHGVTRSTLSQEAAKARQYVATLMTDAGLSVRVDQIGNIIGRMDSKENRERAAVMTGSHLDTSCNSGKYHGTIGILSAIAAAKKLKTQGPLSHPVEIIAFSGEEAGNFGIPMLGSKVAAGAVNLKTLAGAKDKQGTRLSQALEAQGFDPKDIAAAQISTQYKAFLELYIEQGRILGKKSIQIGIAQNIAGTTKCKITVKGVSTHAGWTPMDERQDALVSAAMITLAVQEIAEESEFDALTTVSDIKVSPGTIHAVPESVEMLVNISCAEKEGIIETLQEIKDAISVIAEDQGTPVSIEIFSAEKPVKLSPVVAEVIEKACQTKGLAYSYINSGSTHDAGSMSGLIPSGIIFIPCQSGNEEYSVAPAAIQNGLAVLTQALYLLAK